MWHDCKLYCKKQVANNSCGHASLQMIINYYSGIDVDQKTLIKQMPPNDLGISLFDLKKLSEEYNLILESFVTKDLNNLKNIPINKGPLLLVIKKNNLFHFIIVFKKRFNSFFICDPEQGIGKWIKMQELQEKWLGIFATFNPKYDYSFIKSKKSDKAIIQKTPINKSVYFFVFFTSLISGLFALISGYYFKVIISNIENFSNWKIILFIILFFLFSTILQKTIYILNLKISSYYCNKYINYMFEYFYSNLDKLKNPYEQKKNIIDATNIWRRYINWRINNLLLTPFKLFVSFCYLLVIALISWKIALSNLGILFLLTLFLLITKKFHLAKTKKLTSIKNDVYEKSSRLFFNLENLVYQRKTKKRSLELINANKKMINLETNYQFSLNAIFIIISFVSILSTTLIYLFMGIKIKNNEISAFEIITISLIIFNFWYNINSLVPILLTKIDNNSILLAKNILELYPTKNKLAKSINELIIDNKTIFKKGKHYILKREFTKKDNLIIETIINKNLTTKPFKTQKFNYFLCQKQEYFLDSLPIKNIINRDDSSKKLFFFNLKKYNIEKIMTKYNINIHKPFNPLTEKNNDFINIINLLSVFSVEEDIYVFDQCFDIFSSELKYYMFKIILKHLKNKITIIFTNDNDILKWSKQLN